jgi:phosphatidylglycerol---prolipoprotein diacylglyceryl transferase
VTPQWHLGPIGIPVHGLFVGLGGLAAVAVFAAEACRRGAINEQSLVAVTSVRRHARRRTNR